ncbi:MAG: MBL fold metallo-hydrolase [Desulfatiglans sp.]|jgi:glyoxylase-like metal-dependent hydrolase (beta-lactamase superfamily II)|nr:MBL fold metallo-hydrolase [Desulfatiglans sp.]
MKQVTRGVYFIQGQDALIPDAHAYVIGEPSSKDLTLVEAGLMGKGNYKIDCVVELGIDPADIKRVILTHTHLDHIGCLQEILDRLPNVELWMQKTEAELLEQGDERAAYGMQMFQAMLESHYGFKPGSFCFKTDRKLEGDEILEIGGMTWEVIHIPGHSPGSIGLYNRDMRILIPGDVVYSDYAIGRFDLHGADGPELRKSLLALSELEVDILLPGHNSIVENLPPGYIAQVAEQWGPFLKSPQSR